MTFTNEKDIEIFLELGKHTRYDYTHVDDDLGRDIGEKFGEVATMPEKSLTEAMEQFRSKMITLVEEWILPNYETVYGE